MSRDTEAVTHAVEAGVQCGNLAHFVELQARRICSVRGVAPQWQALALIAADLRTIADELKAAAGAGGLEMAEGWSLGDLDPVTSP